MPRPTDTSSVRPVSPGADASLSDWLSYLESIHPVEIDLGLDRVLTVFRRLFRNRPKARIITVAGTNGKGSAVAVLESLLGEAGRTVGAYTSPHLALYNERIRVNGREASDADIVSAFAKVEAARGQVSLSYFEFGTLAAFQVFADAGLADWVLEVGLGGRLDAVNIMDADLAIITSVDIDHVSFLGGDRETIGFEKAGILRQGRPAIYGESAPPRSVLQQVAAQRIPLRRIGVDYRVTETESGAELDTGDLGRTFNLPVTPLPLNSVAAAVVGALMLEPGLADQQVLDAVAKVRLAGRFEKMSSSPDIYVDVGHNPHAAAWLATRIARVRPAGARVLGVYACLEDKDADGVVAALRNSVDVWVLGGLDCPRGRSASELSGELAQAFPELQFGVEPSVVEALAKARELAGDGDIIVVFGSFFTVAEARAAL